MPIAMLTSIILTANHYILDPVLAIPVVAVGLVITLGGRWLVLRILSPEGKAARESGWVGWVYWLVGIDETTVRRRERPRQLAWQADMTAIMRIDAGNSLKTDSRPGTGPRPDFAGDCLLYAG